MKLISATKDDEVSIELNGLAKVASAESFIFHVESAKSWAESSGHTMADSLRNEINVHMPSDVS